MLTKKLKICLILASLMIFAGCSTKPQGTPTIETHVVTLPSHLLRKFCDWSKPGETVGDLGMAYVNNTVCGRKYEAQVDEQIIYIESVRKEVEMGHEPKK